MAAVKTAVNDFVNADDDADNFKRRPATSFQLNGIWKRF